MKKNDHYKESTPIWPLGPKNLHLTKDDVHVWRVFLPQGARIKNLFLDTLSLEELNKLSKFYFTKDSDQYLISRGGLRQILSRYLGRDAAEIEISTGKFGKPYIKKSPIYFNTAHSSNCIMYIIARQKWLGIDVEECKEGFDCLKLAQNYFSTKEYDKIALLNPKDQYQAFFRCWIRKEAIVKATGEGINFPFNQISVTLLPSENAELLESSSSLYQDVGLWKMAEIIPRENYIAAIAIKHHPVKIQLWDLLPPSKLM